MANNSWNSWIFQVQSNGYWTQYNGYNYRNNKLKCRDNNRQIPIEYKHKPVIGTPNRILYFDVLHSTIRVTTHVLYQVLCIHGEIQRIVIYTKYRKRKALVEFVREEDAKKVCVSNHIKLEGFTLKTEYAKVSSLNVLKNNEWTWDYTQEPMLEYVNGLPTLKSSSNTCVSVEKCNIDPPLEADSKINVINQCWEIFDEFGLVELIKLREKSATEKSYNHWSQLNSVETRTKHQNFRDSDKLSVLTVNGLDAAKSDCNRLFRLLSLYASVTRINYSRKLNCADVEIGKCDSIDALAKIQNFTLSHGKNLSFQYLKNDWSVVHRTIDRFDLPNKSPSCVHYDRRIQTDLSPGPSKIVRFYGAPPDITHDELVSLLKLKMSVQQFDVKIMTKGTKRSVAHGEIRFATVPEAIEAVMSINYVVFQSKNDTKKKKYVLNLVFSP